MTVKLGAKYGILLIAFATLFEVLSLIFWTQFGIDRISYHLQVNVDGGPSNVDTENLPLQIVVPHPFLGWSPNREHPSYTAEGRRQSPPLPTAKILSAYGDSFVFGAQVSHEDSFPHQLSLMIKNVVENYGVGGYGPDQAVMRLEQHLRLGKRPQLVVLGMPSENIARVVNVIRKLYVPSEEWHFIKPIFVKKGNEWNLLNDVPRWPPIAEKWEKLIDTAKNNDMWFAQNKSRPRAGFPFSLMTIQTIKFFAFDVLRWQDLYVNKRAVSTLSYVLRRFVELSKRYQFTPAFVVIPMPEDLLRLRSNKKAYFSQFLKITRQEFKNDLLVVDVLDQTFDYEKFHVKPFSGHASAYGNRIIAAAIYERIHSLFKK